MILALDVCGHRQEFGLSVRGPKKCASGIDSRSSIFIILVIMMINFLIERQTWVVLIIEKSIGIARIPAILVVVPGPGKGKRP